ncbi:MAG: CHRD domain-containing protein [Burkholderiaceae bacterium]|jgi:hypothetical protein|nr:CHRD domain-containing protein [Burkholderiaceae bacterium]
MSVFVSVSSRTSLMMLATVLIAGCTSVDLDPYYKAPTVRVPEPLPPASAEPPVATTQSVLPTGQSIERPLPPLGAAGATPAPSAVPQTPPPTAGAQEQENLVTLTTRLEGLAVNPPSDSTGSGQFDALYDASTRLLRWKASWSGLSGTITAVQFHGPADGDQNGPPAMIWPAPFGPTYEGRATLTPQQVEDLLQGRWYVSVFTTTYPAGELRGQLRVVQ